MLLSIPTLYTVIFANFVCLAIVWLFIAHSYPHFRAARIWSAAAFVAALGGAVSMFRSEIDPTVAVVIGNNLFILSAWMGALGLQSFFGRPHTWGIMLISIALGSVSLYLLVAVKDSIAGRIATYGAAQTVPLLVGAYAIIKGSEDGILPGAKLALSATFLTCAAHLVRSVAAFAEIGGPVSFLDYNMFQASIFLALVFFAMAWNLGYLLMAMDRVRADAAHLALLDDLTGAANRRQFLQRLEAECAMTRRSGGKFTLMAVDLDGFKSINDTHGHGAGDACLRAFTVIAQSRLRGSDLLGRTGGDEFMILLPATGEREAAGVARDLIEACRANPLTWGDHSLLFSASIGIAAWSHHNANDPTRLMAMADTALYAAKKQGKDRHVFLDESPDLQPSYAMDILPDFANPVSAFKAPDTPAFRSA